MSDARQQVYKLTSELEASRNRERAQKVTELAKLGQPSERWTFVRHENGATTWHEGTSGVSPPFGVPVEVVPADRERALEEALEIERKLAKRAETRCDKVKGESRALAEAGRELVEAVEPMISLAPGWLPNLEAKLARYREALASLPPQEPEDG